MCSMVAALTAGAVGSVMQGMAANSAARATASAQEAAAAQNAAVAEAQGHDAVERGGQEELRLRRSLARQMGNARAQAAASGIDPDLGSLMEVRNASLSEGERDAAAIRYNAARERWGYLNQANAIRTEGANAASISRAQGSNALFGSFLGAGANAGLDWWRERNTRP